MTATKHCARCGRALAPAVLDGLCPKCLAVLAFTPEEVGEPGGPSGAVPDGSLRSKLRCFGDYELLEEIARGGMGVVFKARQVSLNRIVAVKMLLSGQFAKKEFVERFHAEARAAANLQHPNIVAIHEVGEHEGQQYFSMDYVEGQNLAQVVAERTRRSAVPPGYPRPSDGRGTGGEGESSMQWLRRAAVYLKTIAKAIHYAHERGVLHRDLKPSNILIDLFDEPRVTDFGLAKQLQGDSDLTLTGQMIGTPRYMPPEQAQGRRGDTTVASDIYSLGAILYHLLTGRPPFEADSTEGVLQQVLHQEPVPPRFLNSGVPRDLETICLKCLSKESRRRYASAQALADDLGRFLNDEPIEARPIGNLEKLWRWCRRKPALATAVATSAALVMTLIVGGGVAVTRINRERVRAENLATAEAAHRRDAEANERQARSEAAKSEHVVNFLSDLLRTAGPDSAAGRDTTAQRESLIRTETQLAIEFADQPEIEAELRLVLGQLYLAYGDPVRAEAQSRMAIRAFPSRYGPTHSKTLDAQFNLALALRDQTRMSEFAPLIRDILQQHVRTYGSNNVRTAELLNNVAIVARDSDQRLSWLFGSLEILRRIGATNHYLLGTTLENLGTQLRLEGRLAEAEPYAREAVEAHRRAVGAEHLRTLLSQRELARLLILGGSLTEAESRLQQALVSYQRILGGDHSLTLEVQMDLVQVMLRQGRESDAQPLLQRLTDTALGWTNAPLTTSSSFVLFTLGCQLADAARSHEHRGDGARARQASRDAVLVLAALLKAREASLPSTDWTLPGTRSLLGGAMVTRAAVDTSEVLLNRLGWLGQAETLLLSSYNALTNHSTMPAPMRPARIQQTVERLARLYQIWSSLDPNPAYAENLARWNVIRGALEQPIAR